MQEHSFSCLSQFSLNIIPNTILLSTHTIQSDTCHSLPYLRSLTYISPTSIYFVDINLSSITSYHYFYLEIYQQTFQKIPFQTLNKIGNFLFLIPCFRCAFCFIQLISKIWYPVQPSILFCNVQVPLTE